MAFRCGPSGLLCLIVGTVLAVLSTLTYTGITALPALGTERFIELAYLLMAVGIVLILVDRRLMRRDTEDLELTTACREMCGKVGTDGYTIDLAVLTAPGKKKNKHPELSPQAETLDARTVGPNGFVGVLFPPADPHAESVLYRKELGTATDGYLVALCLRTDLPAEEPALLYLCNKPMRQEQ